MPSIDLVIPSYGGPLIDTLEAVNKAGWPNMVYVIDNQDNLPCVYCRPSYTLKILDDKINTMRIMFPGRNIGWEAGLNVG